MWTRILAVLMVIGSIGVPAFAQNGKHENHGSPYMGIPEKHGKKKGHFFTKHRKKHTNRGRHKGWYKGKGNIKHDHVHGK